MFSTPFSGFSQTDKIELRKIKLKDFFAHFDNLKNLIVFLDSTKDYSSFDFISYTFCMKINGFKVCELVGGHTTPSVNKMHNQVKPGKEICLGNIKYVPLGQKSPVKKIPDIYILITQ